MKIDKAIEVLTRHPRGIDPLGLPDFQDALKLGIEALKQVDFNRKHYPTNDPELLPGETPEEEAKVK